MTTHDRELRILLADELTSSLLDERSSLIKIADACWAAKAQEWIAAERALDDPRWWTGDYRLFDRADDDLAMWSYAVVDAQTSDPLTPIARAMIANGLQARLKAPARARAIARAMRGGFGAVDGRVRVDIVARDPYLRACSFADDRVRGRTEVQLHAHPDGSALTAGLRERATASAGLRSLGLTVGAWGRRRAAPAPRKTLALFPPGRGRAPGRGHADPFAPIAMELGHRGWRTAVFAYDRVAAPERDIVAFTDAVRAAGPRVARIRPRRWHLDPDLLSRSPVTNGATLLALNASWVSAMVQVERHRRVLDTWQPEVVVSFGPDTMSLALHGAARERGIPSVFLPHGFIPGLTVHWSLTATATAVPGRGCVEHNAVNPLGERQEGLVVIGHPDYDELFRRVEVARMARRADVAGTPSRPYRVLLFTDWGRDLLDQRMQRRTLEMSARALPADAFLICKLHPGWEQRERCEEVLGGILPSDAFRVVSSQELRTPELLERCDVAVATEESMALIDALVAGVPGIGIRHPENPLGTGGLRHPARDIKKVCRVAETDDDLRRAMTGLTRDTAARSELLAAREGYIRRYLFAPDGRSSARAADLVEHLAAGGMPGTFVPRVEAEVTRS